MISGCLENNFARAFVYVEGRLWVCVLVWLHIILLPLGGQAPHMNIHKQQVWLEVCLVFVNCAQVSTGCANNCITPCKGCSVARRSSGGQLWRMHVFKVSKRILGVLYNRWLFCMSAVSSQATSPGDWRIVATVINTLVTTVDERSVP